MDEFVKDAWTMIFMEKEAFRSVLVNKLPKYGNGDPMVDGLAKDFVEFLLRGRCFKVQNMEWHSVQTWSVQLLRPLR